MSCRTHGRTQLRNSSRSTARLGMVVLAQDRFPTCVSMERDTMSAFLQNPRAQCKQTRKLSCEDLLCSSRCFRLCQNVLQHARCILICSPCQENMLIYTHEYCARSRRPQMPVATPVCDPLAALPQSRCNEADANICRNYGGTPGEERVPLHLLSRFRRGRVRRGLSG